MTTPDQAPWTSPGHLRSHYHKHGYRLGKWDVLEYDKSARGTIRAGKRFTFQERDSGIRRVGYFDDRNDRLTVMNENEARIISHFRCDEDYCRRQLNSDYRRH